MSEVEIFSDKRELVRAEAASGEALRTLEPGESWQCAWGIG